MRWKSLRTFAALSGLAFWGCLPKPIPTDPGNPEWGIDITWHGQSCFTLRDSIGRTLVIDPFDDTVGYGRLALRADAVLVTHAHFDHNNKAPVRARLRNLELVESSGTQVVAGQLSINGVDSFHDKHRGEIYGKNRMYGFYLGGMRVIHMGDFGEERVTEAQRFSTGAPDILFIPIGGFTTLNPREAKAIVDQLKPRAVFPMHYGNIRFYKLAEVKEFTDLFPSEQVKVVESSPFRIRQSDLTLKPVVYVLKPVNRNY